MRRFLQWTNFAVGTLCLGLLAFKGIRMVSNEDDQQRHIGYALLALCAIGWGSIVWYFFVRRYRSQRNNSER